MNEMSIQDKDSLLQIQSMVNENMVEWALQKTYEYAKLMSYYKCAMMEIETKFNVLNEEFSLQFDRQPIIASKHGSKTRSAFVKSSQLRGMSFHWTALNRTSTMSRGYGLYVPL